MAEAAIRGDWRRYALLTVPAIVLLGWASGWLSGSGYENDWFAALVKPPFMPPGWLFPVAWTILYALMGLALALILAEPPSPLRSAALAFFFIQLALNYAWSPIFFAGHDIDLGATVIYLMLLFALVAAFLFRRIRPVAGWLLLPYLLWLCFAGTLNSTVGKLNPGAGSSLLG